MEYTKEDKVQMIMNSPDVQQAVKILIAGFMDMELETHMHAEYECFGHRFKLSFDKISKGKIMDSEFNKQN